MYKTDIDLDYVEKALIQNHYIPEDNIITVVFLALGLKKPILIEGPPGTGKTELSKAISEAFDRDFYRIQCYEGITFEQIVGEWNYQKQLLSLEISKINGTTDDVFQEEFFIKRPLLSSFMIDKDSVILIDEIDKADEEVESFLLQALGEKQITVNDLGTFYLKNDLLVIMTSNSQRQLLDETKDRCLYLYIDYPTFEREMEIVKSHVPEAPVPLIKSVVKVIQKIRKMNLIKTPSIRASVDWVRSLLIFDQSSLDNESLTKTINVVVKNEEDKKKVLKKYKTRLKFFLVEVMDEIIKFSGILRENGIPASIRSTQTAYQAISLIKDNKPDLRELLACIYLKDQRQRKKFNECYESFFENKGQKSKQPSSKQEDKSKYIRKLNISVTKQNKADFNYNNNQQMKLDYIKNTLNDVSDNANYEGNSKLIKSNIHTLNTLQPELIDLCQKLGRKIATRRVRRFKQSKKQKPDIRRTIRKNLKHGGSLLELVKSKPRIKKQNHFFLSDVSVSCDWISIWFFCMIYAAQNSFNRARAFEFDNETAEITSALHELNIVDAFIKVLNIRKKNSMIQGKSNMFTAFQSFLNQANINHKSYVLILSDCRDWAGPKYEREPLSADFISSMARKAKRVLILNPEPKIKWNAADSCVSSYEDAGAEAFEVSNLEQLADLIINI